MDFKLLVDSLLSGAPLAVLAALVGLLWQAFYVRSRDKLHDEQARRELMLEEKKVAYQQEIETSKFKHQQALEELRFQYEQRSWRQKLAQDLTVELVKARLPQYAVVWSHVEGIASSHGPAQLATDTTKDIAREIKKWRYSQGGLLAEETTREAAYAFQTALWEYDGSANTYRQMRRARRLFLAALRADIGLGEDITGQTIYEATERRQKIQEELEKLQATLGIEDKEKLS